MGGTEAMRQNSFTMQTPMGAGTPKPSPLYMLLGMIVGYLVIQLLSVPLSLLVTHVIVPWLETTQISEGILLSLSLLMMIAIWIVVCVIGGYISGLLARRRVVVVALIVGVLASIHQIYLITPDLMLFTYSYLKPATIVYSTVIGGALVLSSEKVLDE